MSQERSIQGGYATLDKQDEIITELQSLTVSAGAIQYKRDAADTFVSEDTITPANSRGLPTLTIGTTGNIQDVNISNEALVSDAALDVSLSTRATEATLSTLNGKVTVCNTGATVISSSALPTGASTEATLASIDGNIITCNTGAVVISSSALPTGAATQATLASIDGNITTCNTGAVVISSSALPTGAATQATLASINGNITTCNTGAVVISSSALPSGAATQATLASIDGNITTCNTGAVTISSALPAGSNNIGDVDIASALPAGSNNIGDVDIASQVSATGRAKVDLIRNDYTGTSVTTGAYVQLIASTSSDIEFLEVFDSSGQTLLFAVGAAASEVDQFHIIPGGNEKMPLTIPSGSRLSVKAVTATADTGELVINTFS